MEVAETGKLTKAKEVSDKRLFKSPQTYSPNRVGLFERTGSLETRTTFQKNFVKSSKTYYEHMSSGEAKVSVKMFTSLTKKCETELLRERRRQYPMRPSHVQAISVREREMKETKVVEDKKSQTDPIKHWYICGRSARAMPICMRSCTAGQLRTLIGTGFNQVLLMRFYESQQVVFHNVVEYE